MNYNLSKFTDRDSKQSTDIQNNIFSTKKVALKD